MYIGKIICRKLREIRCSIAMVNDITYVPHTCTYKGPCNGTCPLCDSELEYLNEQLELKQKKGEQIKWVTTEEDCSPALESEEEQRETLLEN